MLVRSQSYQPTAAAGNTDFNPASFGARSLVVTPRASSGGGLYFTGGVDGTFGVSRTLLYLQMGDTNIIQPFGFPVTWPFLRLGWGGVNAGNFQLDWFDDFIPAFGTVEFQGHATVSPAGGATSSLVSGLTLGDLVRSVQLYVTMTKAGHVSCKLTTSAGAMSGLVVAAIAAAGGGGLFVPGLPVGAAWGLDCVNDDAVNANTFVASWYYRLGEPQ